MVASEASQVIIERFHAARKRLTIVRRRQQFDAHRLTFLLQPQTGVQSTISAKLNDLVETFADLHKQSSR